ncbi:exotoxin OB-fold domain-containing protein [Staphylococcus agnetis]|uniref:exotoxin OB-fold domain-containing protein n=1 Tax=Staphylococcus agnetis TaxID=985762 RepID=UPI00338EF4ED
MSDFYKSTKWHIDEQKMNANQLLANDLIFDDIYNQALDTDSIKVGFQDNTLTSQFKDKELDIYGISFANNCVGLVGHKTACIYGGVTIQAGNQLDEEKIIGINVFKDNSKHETLTISTKKKWLRYKS